jgi:8-oxo-dGTP pyrophosphatase MutT (NUDIX family)
MPAMHGQMRRAASAIVGRDAPDGLEVLVLERGASSRFLPGYVAFPGGSIDREDEDHAVRWFGTAEESRRACAVRELVEEVSLVLTADGLGSGDGLEAVDFAPPSPAQLVDVAHWVAPVEVPVRFDARYYAIRAPMGLEPVPDGRETSAAWWISPRRLLADWHQTRRLLFWPTYFTVESLATCETVDDLVALRIDTREPDDEELRRLPRSVFWQDRG